MSDEHRYRLHSVEVESFKRLEYLLLRPRRGLTLIGGANRQGKTSLLDAIKAALSGKDGFPAEPIKRGKRQSVVKLELGDGQKVELRIELDLKANGTSKLTVLDADGNPIKAPTTFLRELFTKNSFNPLAFANAEAKEQDRILKDLLPELDFTKQNQERAAAYATRTRVNADVDARKLKLKENPPHEGVPSIEIPVVELRAQLRLVEEHEDKELALLSAIDGAEQSVDEYRGTVERLEYELKLAREAMVLREAALVEAKKARDDLPPCAHTREAVEKRMETADETNRKVRENAEREKSLSGLRDMEAEAEALTATIKRIDDYKQKRLAEANYPVKGLGFDELGPTFEGFPIGQASHSDRVKLSVAIMAALNPRLGLMLVPDGEKSGTEDLAIISDIADQQGFDILMERMTESGEGCHVVIEDGRVKSVREEAAHG